MSLVWITSVINHRGETFQLRQNDPTKHPVINGHHYKRDEVITVGPSANLNASWFVIPWTQYGRLLVNGPAGNLRFDVGPGFGDNLDHLRMYDDQDNQTMAAPAGPKGDAAYLSLELVFNDSGMHWNIVNASQVGADLLDKFENAAISAAVGALGKLV